jgi:hypothetical protein
MASALTGASSEVCIIHALISLLYTPVVGCTCILAVFSNPNFHTLHNEFGLFGCIPIGPPLQHMTVSDNVGSRSFRLESQVFHAIQNMLGLFGAIFVGRPCMNVDQNIVGKDPALSGE